jgi:hypothetical protein
MAPLGWYVVGALALILAIFYLVRRIPAYIALSAVVVVAFAAATFARVDWAYPSDWVVAVVGLFLCVFGLLIVRVMLIRSVSLQLLARIDSGRQESIVEDIGGRLHDMIAFGLIRPMPDGTRGLTPFGRFVSGVVAVFYSVFRIDT